MISIFTNASLLNHAFSFVLSSSGWANNAKPFLASPLETLPKQLDLENYLKTSFSLLVWCALLTQEKTFTLDCSLGTRFLLPEGGSIEERTTSVPGQPVLGIGSPVSGRARKGSKVWRTDPNPWCMHQAWAVDPGLPVEGLLDKQCIRSLPLASALILSIKLLSNILSSGASFLAMTLHPTIFHNESVIFQQRFGSNGPCGIFWELNQQQCCYRKTHPVFPTVDLGMSLQALVTGTTEELLGCCCLLKKVCESLENTLFPSSFPVVGILWNALWIDLAILCF